MEHTGTRVALTTAATNSNHTDQGDTENNATTTTVVATSVATTTLNSAMVLSAIPPIPLSAYVSLSQTAISSVLKVAMFSTSMSLGLARNIVTGLDMALGFAVRGVTGQTEETRPG
ncbi:hypothetical protein BGZ65_011208, partial [Modicella reniformis]